VNRFAALRRVLSVALVALAAAAPPTGGMEAKGAETDPITFEASGQSLSWRPQVEYERLVLTVVGSGARLQREFERGEKPEINLEKEKLADGPYKWEMRVIPVVSDEMRRHLAKMRSSTDRSEGREDSMEGLPEGRFVQAGTFAVHAGQVLKPDENEVEPQPQRPTTRQIPGDLEVLGDLTVRGAKQFAMSDPEDSARTIVYAALEGPEVGTYYRGTARILGGGAVIELPEHFAKTTEPVGLTVQLTPLDGWASLYVAEKTSHRLVVRDASGEDGARFDFFIQGVRKGFALFSAESADSAEHHEGDRDDLQ
jgi:hypothetical protein